MKTYRAGYLQIIRFREYVLDNELMTKGEFSRIDFSRINFYELPFALYRACEKKFDDLGNKRAYEEAHAYVAVKDKNMIGCFIAAKQVKLPEDDFNLIELANCHYFYYDRKELRSDAIYELFED